MGNDWLVYSCVLVVFGGTLLAETKSTTTDTSKSIDLIQTEQSGKCRDVYDDPLESQEPWKRLAFGCCLAAFGWWLGVVRGGRLWITRQIRWWDYLLTALGALCFVAASGVLVFGHLWPPKRVCGEESHIHSTICSVIMMPDLPHA